MKIKNWLMISHFLVMLLPIAAIYLLYISLSNFDEEQDLKEYLAFQEIVRDLESELSDLSLYHIQPGDNYQHLYDLTDDSLKIDLYRYDGVHLFSSLNPPGTAQLSKMNLERLFRNLNEYQKNPRTYSTKRLVFDEEDQLAGLYEITLSRNAWVETSNKRTMLMIGLSGVFFIALYIAVVIAINRKLNHPLQRLQHHMQAFAAGKKPEEPLTQSKDEIGVLNQHFEQMKTQILETRDALAGQQREKEYMVASLSHDLKTPLTVIRTYTEALESHHLTTEEREEYKRILDDKLNHMEEMINDLSVFTALQSKDNLLNKVQVNGDEFFDMLFSGYEEACSDKSIKLKVEINVRNAYRLDPKQMIRTVDNLMDNSIRYTPENRRIWLAGIASSRALPDWVFPEYKDEVNTWRENGTVILIQNEGRGLKQDQLEKMFHPFYQDDASRGKGATSGLGLSIAKMIIEKHGGKIKGWSTENKGTLFACWLKE
jgi:signal transduction histidine kinase